jgi:hypothetical protein
MVQPIRAVHELQRKLRRGDRLLQLIAALVALLVVPAAPSGKALSDDTLSGRVLTDAFRVIPLASGRLLALFHIDGIPQDSTAVGALLLTKDGREWQLRASKFVPPGELLAGSAGQIYGAAISDDEQTAALSIGWLTPCREGRNAIVILQKGSDRLFHPLVLLRCDVGLGDVVFTPSGDIAVVTQFATHKAVITVFNRSGAVVRELFNDLIPAGRRGSDLQLVRVDASRYALVDLRTATLYNLEMGRSGRLLGSLDLNAGLQSLNTLGAIQTVAFLGLDEVMAIRQRVTSKPDTIVTVQSAARSAQWQIGRPSRTAFWDGEQLSIVTSLGTHPYLQHYSLQDIRKGVAHAQ